MQDEMNQHKMMAMGKGIRGYAAGGQVTTKVGKAEPRKAPPMPGKSGSPNPGNKTNAIPAFKGGGKVGKK